MDPIKDKIDIQDSLEKRINQFNEEYSKELLDKIYLFIDKFKKEKGLDVLQNESIIIDKMAYEIVNDFKYKANVSNIGLLLPSFDELDEVTKRILETLNDDFDFNALNFDTEKKFVINELTHSLLRSESLSVKIGITIKKVISKSILQGGSINELKKDMELALLSNGYNEGMLSDYATQITTDAILQYTGIINGKIVKEGKFNAIGYTGSLIETSRVQCVRWRNDKNGILLFDQKQPPYGFLPDEVIWAKENGVGYGKKGTSSYVELTLNNFCQIRGGKGCRHDALPFQWNDKKQKYFEKLDANFQRERARLIEEQKNKKK